MAIRQAKPEGAIRFTGTGTRRVVLAHLSENVSTGARPVTDWADGAMWS